MKDIYIYLGILALIIISGVLCAVVFASLVVRMLFEVFLR